MASGYVAVESDEREHGPESLEFQSFLPNEGDASNNNTTSNNSNSSRGYLTDTPRGGFLSIEYYQQYFDVDTKTVLERCYSTLLPISATHRTTHLTPSPDLYGPFWTLTTLIFALFVSSSLASNVAAYLSSTPVDYDYDFKLLSLAVTIVYAYGLAFPVLLWLALRYMGVTEWSVVEAIAVWGYGQFVWIPVAFLCVIPIFLVRLILVVIAFGLSGYFLLVNIYPVLSSAEAKSARLLVIIVAVLHAALALTFLVVFFSYYAVHEIGPKDPIGDDTGPVGGASSIISSAVSSSMEAAATARMLW
ncbi:Yip1 domain family protein [Rickenella mellea]|uniref:Protein YIP n=1 Tax=Rickenella mellea TaxID=50990 RepID=A0A4Y7QJI2_9AGAM|nr:Yip1 domain family protein [Rickenella mellea]